MIGLFRALAFLVFDHEPGRARAHVITGPLAGALSCSTTRCWKVSGGATRA